jgi:surface polysaccharide O-acyltransferase-like enzyme
MDPRYTPPHTPDPTAEWKPDALAASVNTSNVHIALAGLYGMLGALVIYMATKNDDSDHSSSIAVAAFFCVPVLLHALIAYGARRRRGWARGTSKAVGILMLLGFPIGTLIGFYLIRNASKAWGPPVQT